MEQDWTGIVMALGVLVLISTIIVVVLVQGAKIARARMTAVAAQEYRSLAERYETLAASGAQDLRRTAEAVEDVRARLDSVERLLRSVE
ncbi:hypothetical protein ACH9EU_00930 [Kocuria sp. M1R5S2]|uniref:hypothetical protein n=1 Tax=Kocuria rhizosphaerae TaxID=3376285 RepID=UPI00378AC888